MSCSISRLVSPVAGSAFPQVLPQPQEEAVVSSHHLGLAASARPSKTFPVLCQRGPRTTQKRAQAEVGGAAQGSLLLIYARERLMVLPGFFLPHP